MQIQIHSRAGGYLDGVTPAHLHRPTLFSRVQEWEFERPQAGQSGFRCTTNISKVDSQRSMVSNPRLRASGSTMSFMTSKASIPPSTPGAGPTMPAVSQVGVEPGVGDWGKTHRRQGPSPGTTVNVIPEAPITPAYTHGIDLLTA